MQRNGDSETPLEQWLLKSGLGVAYLMEVDEHNLTKAQADRLADSKPQPLSNPRHRRLYDYFQDAAEREDSDAA